MKNLLIISIAFISITSCTITEDKTLYPQGFYDEYTVLNHILPQLGEMSPISFYFTRPYLSDSIEKKIFFEKHDSNQRQLMFSNLKNQGIDSSEVNFGSIQIQVIGETLEAFDSLNSVKIDLNRINRPKGVILITENDTLYNKEEMEFKRFTLSRVLIDKETNKAYFEYGISKGGLSGGGYKVEAILKNGAWTILKKKMTWIS